MKMAHFLFALHITNIPSKEVPLAAIYNIYYLSLIFPCEYYWWLTLLTSEFSLNVNEVCAHYYIIQKPWYLHIFKGRKSTFK